jgi:hypothetical protein
VSATHLKHRDRVATTHAIVGTQLPRLTFRAAVREREKCARELSDSGAPPWGGGVSRNWDCSVKRKRWLSDPLPAAGHAQLGSQSRIVRA